MTRISEMTPLSSLSSGSYVPIEKTGSTTNYRFDLASLPTSDGLFTDAATLSVPIGFNMVATTGYAALGVGAANYIYDAAVNSAYVTANPRTSFMSANSRGFRLDHEEVITPLMFGAVGDNVTDDSSAFVAALAYLKSIGVNPYTGYTASPELFIPAGTYYLATTPLDIKHTLRIRGEGSGMAAGLATKLRWAADVAGFRVQRADTTAENGAGASTTGGDGTTIEGLYIESAGGTPSLLKSGIWLRARASIRDVYVVGFPGCGVLVSADTGGSGAAYGNANNWNVNVARLQSNKYGGILVQGGDSNAGIATMIDATSNARFGILDASFLGCTWLACHADANGLSGSAGLTQTSVVSDGTWRYQLIKGQDASAAGTAPTVGATNAVWQLQGPGSAGGAIPTYSTYVAGGGSFVSGGGYYIGGGGNGRSALVGCYSETGQADPIVVGPSVALGGFLAQGAQESGLNQIASTQDGVCSAGGFGKRVQDMNTNAVMEAFVGERGMATVLRTSHSTKGPNTFRLMWGHTAGGGFDPNNLWFNYSYNNDIYRITGPSTPEDFGTGTAQPYYFHPTKLAVGAYGAARIVTYGSVAPTTGAHAQGEVVFNLAPTLSGIASWLAVAGGTSGTWAADYVNARADPSTGVGYVTGAGGAVTQATSRTTGVTLNKVCGQITLFSVAGSATYQTFTVTNSTVAATDSIRVVQASGTDLYQIHVTNVAAGSFKISFATTGGTTVEAPVFNFAVIKAVAA